MQQTEETFSSRLKTLMKENHVTQQALAEKIEITRQAVSNYTGAERIPDGYILTKIADYFNVSTDYLLCRTDIKTADPEIQSVCEFTGLSVKVIKNIRSFPFCEMYSSDLSNYLENVDLIDFISTFQTFISEYAEMDNTVKELENSIDELSDQLSEFETNEQYEKYDETKDEIETLLKEKKDLKDRHDFLIWKMEKSIKNFVESEIKKGT